MCWKCQNMSAITWYLTFFNQRWRCPSFFRLDVSSACPLHLSAVNSSGLRQISSDIKLLQIYFDISSTFDLHKQVYIFDGSRVWRKIGKSSPLVKKRQISSFCRHIWTFSAHWNFVSRSTSSMVLEPRSGASRLKKHGNLLWRSSGMEMSKYVCNSLISDVF